MISCILFMNQKGEPVIYRSYRDDVEAVARRDRATGRSAAELFRTFVIQAKEAVSPILAIDKYQFLHVRHSNMYIVAVTTRNVNAALVFQFLMQLIDVLKSYFGGKLSIETLSVSFPIVYELLDEVMDFGYPQVMAPDILKLYITQEGMRSDSAEKNTVPVQATGAISWRREGLKYRKNEVFIDVVEDVNLLMSAKSTILRQDVSGRVMIKAYLSGMPECTFGMNDKLGMGKDTRAARRGKSAGIELEDVTFHQAVKLGKFDSDRTITFVPPDGEFELMRYRITENVNLPFKVIPVVKELGRTRLEANVKVKSTFSSKLFGLNVIIKIPTPTNTAICHIHPSAGKAKYEPEHNAMVWRIKRFPGEAEFSLSAEVELMSTTTEHKAWSRPPIKMEFQVPMFTASGLHVRYLKVFEKSNYQAVKWVRYVTRAGQYEIRI